MLPNPTASLPLLSGLCWARRRGQGYLRRSVAQESSLFPGPLGTRTASVPETRKDGGGVSFILPKGKVGRGLS